MFASFFLKGFRVYRVWGLIGFIGLRVHGV